MLNTTYLNFVTLTRTLLGDPCKTPSFITDAWRNQSQPEQRGVKYGLGGATQATEVGNGGGRMVELIKG